MGRVLFDVPVFHVCEFRLSETRSPEQLALRAERVASW
jgi:hypothetical protein